MLSIRFDGEREWWTPGAVFERLFRNALAHHRIPADLEEWRHVADANGGFSFDLAEAAVARTLTDGLLAEARAELQILAAEGTPSEDVTYAASLKKLVELFGAPEE